MIVLCIFQPVYKTERRLMLFLQPLEFLFFFFFWWEMKQHKCHVVIHCTGVREFSSWIVDDKIIEQEHEIK